MRSRSRRIGEDLGPLHGSVDIGTEKDDGAVENEATPEDELERLKQKIRTTHRKDIRRELLNLIQVRFGNRAAAGIIEELKMSNEVVEPDDSEKEEINEASNVKKPENE